MHRRVGMRLVKIVISKIITNQNVTVKYDIV